MSATALYFDDGEDVKAVHRDVTALLRAGVLERTEGRGIEFPYEAVKIEFLLQAAWQSYKQPDNGDLLHAR